MLCLTNFSVFSFRDSYVLLNLKTVSIRIRFLNNQVNIIAFSHMRRFYLYYLCNIVVYTYYMWVRSLENHKNY